MRTASVRCEAATRLEFEQGHIAAEITKNVGSRPFRKSNAAAAPIAFGQIGAWSASFLLTHFVCRA